MPKSTTLAALAQMALDAACSARARTAYLRALRKYARKYGLRIRALHNAAVFTLN